MRNWVSISTDETPKYLFYWPITCFAWRTFGWEPIIFYIGKPNKFTELIHKTQEKFMEGETTEMRMLYRYKGYNIENINGYQTSTVAQVSRMYAFNLPFVRGEDVIITSDMDLFPLSDYWRKDGGKTYCYGRNLSDEHQPMAYVSSTAQGWYGIMDQGNIRIEEMIKIDLDRMVPRAKRIWSVDQDLLTQNLERVKDRFMVNIDRPIDPITNYPIGRVDRSVWSLNHKQFIDCHAYHDILTNETRFHDIMMLMHKIWPTHDLKWIPEYYKEFKKLL